jgi:type IV secretory pathway VirD2 relaxase
MESDLGTRLDWLAVDHHNTGHPHTHIVIRGKDAGGRDLVITPAYIREGLAARAQDIVTERLGPRRDLEIATASQSEVTKERFTGLDRAILAGAGDGVARVTEGSGPGGRFDAALRRARLRHLEGLKLAAPAGRDELAQERGEDELVEPHGAREEGVDHEKHRGEPRGTSVRERRPRAGQAGEAHRHGKRRGDEGPLLPRHAADEPGGQQRRHALSDAVEHGEQAAERARKIAPGLQLPQELEQLLTP